ncbi:MFS-type transporter SLC18B1-like [Watersipora subatra]|uniref:MFS-type transporter SLC18B1-like n=1 Tax=Watersipora subatra TaxID=2589382 RepID=UPI00355B3DC5
MSSHHEDISQVIETTSTKAAKRVWTKSEKRILLTCLISQFLSNLIASLPAPFLPSLDESHNIESNITGWIIGLLPLTQLFVCPLYGKLVNYVAVRTMLITGLLLCGCFTVLFGMLEYLPLPNPTNGNVDGMYLCLEIVLRIIQSLGAGAILVGAMTYLTVTFTDNTMTVLGYAQTACGMGYLIGPGVGSGLFKLGGFVAIFTAVGGCMILVGVIAWLILPRDDMAQTENDGSASLRKILFNRNVIASLTLTAFMGTIWSSIEPILEPELREKYGLQEEVSALTFLLVSVTFTVGSPLIAIALDKLSWLTSLPLMMCGFLVNFVTFLFMGPCPLFDGFIRPLWLMLVCLTFMGVGIALGMVPSLHLLSFGNAEKSGKPLGKSAKAILSALWSSAYALGDFIGPTFSGIMTEYINFAWTMTAYALACLLTASLISLVQLYNCVKKRKSRKSTANGIENEETLPLLT